MPKAELLQTAAQVAGQAKELFDAGARTNLLQSLVEQGHPYGLLLGQSSGSSESLLNFFFPPEKATRKEKIRGASGNPVGSCLSFPSSMVSQLMGSVLDPGLKPFWTTSVANSSLINSSGFSLRENNNETFSQRVVNHLNDGEVTLKSTANSVSGLAITGSMKGSSVYAAKNNEAIALKFRWDNLFTYQTFLAPLFLKLFAGENSPERSRELKVGKHSVSLGTTAIQLTTYKGEQPFVVKTPQGDNCSN